MKLYDLELSGHAHRVRLFANILGLQTTIIPVDLLNGAHKEPEYLQKNPFGQVPTLEDSDVTLFDSNAILVYLASKYDISNKWYPNDAAVAAQIQIWLSKATKELSLGPARARLVEVFGAPYDLAELQKASAELLHIMEQHLSGRDWFVSDHATIADIAMYTYTAHAPEGGIDLSEFPTVSAWLERVESLPGFIPMPATETAAKKALAA